MKKNLFKIGILTIALALGSCSKDDEPGTKTPSEDDTRYITLTGSFPDDNGTGGNGGTRAFGISEENAADPNHEVNLFKIENETFVEGIGLKSSRTARVQGSADGKFLYNIQYTGTEGGVFNKYAVGEGADFEEVGYELNTAAILGTAPRWVKAAEGIGVGVYASTYDVEYEGEAPNFTFVAHDSEIKIAVLDLDNTAITNTAIFDFPWSDEERAAGYSVGRVDVPVLNAAQTKLFIGCRVRKLDPTATPTLDEDGKPEWPSDSNIDGTKTLVVDFPSLRNPKVFTSTNSVINNNAYRTMTQYVGTDGHVYQATATSGPDILRISSSTNEYDQSYHFNLDTALGVTGSQIKAWRYVRDGIGVVLYTLSDVDGGYIALINLNDKSATKLSTDIESDAALNSTLGQFQNIGLIGDTAYVPLTPAGKEGAIYVINTQTKEITKGAKLKTISGSYYLGAY